MHLTGSDQYAIVGYHQVLPASLNIGDVAAAAQPVPEWRDWIVTTNTSGHWLDQDQIQNMDPLFFNMSPAEAPTLRPATRLVLELTWKAFEKGGILPSSFKGRNVATIMAAPADGYDKVCLFNRGLHAISRYSCTGACTSTLAGRLSYFYDLHGACLVQESQSGAGIKAIKAAIRMLKLSEAQAVIVGDINLHLWPSSNTLNVEYASVFIFKRLEDAQKDQNRIFSIIKGTDLDERSDFWIPRHIQSTPPSSSPYSHISQSGPFIFTISAKSAIALSHLTTKYIAFLQGSSDSIADICYTTNSGREVFNHRLAIICSTKAELINRLSSASSDSKCTGVASKAGCKYVIYLNGDTGDKHALNLKCNAMLSRDPSFRKSYEDTKAELEMALSAPTTAQSHYVLLFSYQYACCRMLQGHAAEPVTLIGTGIGNVVARCIQGDLPIHEAADVVNQFASNVDPERWHKDRVGLIVRSNEHNIVSFNIASLRIISVRKAYTAVDIMKKDMPALSKACAQSGVSFQIADTNFGWTLPLGMEDYKAPSLPVLEKSNLEIDMCPWLPRHQGDGSDDGIEFLDTHSTIAQLYAKGANVHFLSNGSLVTLPNYPFQKDRYWIDHGDDGIDHHLYQSSRAKAAPTAPHEPKPHSVARPSLSKTVAAPSPLYHPKLHILIGSPQISNDSQIFDHVLDRRALKYLSDHNIDGLFVMPATAYVEICLVIGQLFFDEPATLQQLDLLQPLILDNGTDAEITIRVEVKQRDTHTAALELSARERSVVPFSIRAKANIETQREIKIPRWKRNRENVVAIYDDVAQIYDGLRPLKYGQQFRNALYLAVYPSSAEALIKVDTENFGSKEFLLPPALLDACMHILFAHIAGYDTRSKTQMFPTQLGSISLVGPIPELVLCCWTFDATGKDSRLRRKFSGVLYDAVTKFPFAIIGQFTCSRIPLLVLHESSMMAKDADLDNENENHVAPQLPSNGFPSKFEGSPSIAPKTMATPLGATTAVPTARLMQYEIDWYPEQRKVFHAQIDTMVTYLDDAGLSAVLLMDDAMSSVRRIDVKRGTKFSSENKGMTTNVVIDPLDFDHHRKVMALTAGSVAIVNAWAVDADSMAAVPDLFKSLSLVVESIPESTAASMRTIWISQGAVTLQNLDEIGDMCLEQSPMAGFLLRARKRLPICHHIDLSPDLLADIASVRDDIWDVGSGLVQTSVYRRGKRLIPRLRATPVPTVMPTLLSGTFIVTDNVPLEICLNLQTLGVEYFVVLGRATFSPMADSLGNMATHQQVNLEKFHDVTDIYDAFNAESSVPQITGILQGAESQTDDITTFSTDLCIKTTLVLHELSLEIPTLQHFVLVNPLGTTFGGNDSASLSFMDAFAVWRNAQGLAAVSLQLPLDSSDASLDTAEMLECLSNAFASGSSVQAYGKVDFDSLKMQYPDNHLLQNMWTTSKRQQPQVSADDPLSMWSSRRRALTPSIPSRTSTPASMHRASKTWSISTEANMQPLGSPRSFTPISNRSSPPISSTDIGNQRVGSPHSSSQRLQTASPLVTSPANFTRPLEPQVTKKKVSPLSVSKLRNSEINIPPPLVSPIPKYGSAMSALRQVENWPTSPELSTLLPSALPDNPPTKIEQPAPREALEEIALSRPVHSIFSSTSSTALSHPLLSTSSSTSTTSTSPSSTSSSTSTIVVALIAKLLGLKDELDTDSSFSEYGIDSITFKELTEEIKRLFAVDVPAGTFMSGDRSIQDLLDFVDSEIKDAPAIISLKVESPAERANPLPPVNTESTRENQSIPAPAAKVQLLSTVLLDQLMQELEIPSESLDTDESLPTYGVDSITFGRIQEHISKIYRVDLPADFYSGDRSIRELMEWLDLQQAEIAA